MSIFEIVVICEGAFMCVMLLAIANWVGAISYNGLDVLRYMKK
jgi:hypothetical protein